MPGSIKDCTTLNNGVKMHWLGLGVFQSRDGWEVENAIKFAFDAGYRSIDTATIYGNERGVGKAVRESGLPRSDVFLTSKVWNSDQGYDSTLRDYDKSLNKLGTDYLDLYLIHWPVKGKFKETWKALEKLYSDGRVKAIGVSNFMITHLEDLLKDVEIIPAVNQVEFHPYLVQPELLQFCEEKNIRLEAWSPLMKGKITNIRKIKKLAEKYGKTPAQIVLRWDVQHGVVTIPKSVRKERIIENAQIFDFELSEEDMRLIDSLDRGKRVGPDPYNFNF